MIEGQNQDGVSQVSFPHFMVKNKLLYRVTRKDSEICEQLLVAREYVTKVLYLAHSHLLGAHLGREKTYDVFSAASTGRGSREPWRNTVDTVESVKSTPLR